MSLKILYKPADELLAVRIKDLLEQQGIPAMLRSYQMPWYDGLAKMMRPEWGEVLVAEEDYDRARELRDDLLATLDSPVPPETAEVPDGDDEAEDSPQDEDV